MKILLQFLVLVCCISSLYASTMLKDQHQLRTSQQLASINPDKLYYIRDARSWRYLDNLAGQGNVGLWDWYGGNIQKWKLEYTNGYYLIRNAANTNNLLTCDKKDKCFVSPPANNFYRQKWRLKSYLGKYGSGVKLQIESVDFGTCLDAYGSSNGDRVGTFGWKEGSNQVWMFQEAN